MAKTAEEMIEGFRAFIDFVDGIKELDEKDWNQPISEGKWSIKDIMSHIMLWDKYFYEEGIVKIELEQPLTVRHLDFDEFNANAMEYAKTQTKDELIAQFIEYRTNIVNSIAGLSEDAYLKSYKDGDKKKFSVHSYLRSFISHDKHHKKQIEKYMESLK